MFRFNSNQVSAKELELLREAIKSGQSSFLVKFNGSFRWVIIDLDSLQNRQVRFFFTMYATTEVPFCAIVLPGKEGSQRTLFVRHPITGEIVCARYICFSYETYEADTPIAHFQFEVRVTGEQLTVPITGILPNFPTNLEKEAFDDLQVRKHHAQAGTTRFPLALPRTDVSYPFFSNKNLLVLFLLLKELKQVMEPTYNFQLILIRFIACGDQLKFSDLPQLSDEDEVEFREFSMTYTQVFMGHPMTSQTQRFSRLSVQEVFLAQFKIAKELRINSRPALSLPLSYFIDPEPEVELKKGTHVLIPHSSLEKLE